MVLNSASISARFVGGVIAPIMVLGAMLGASFGLTVQLLFPNHAVPVSVYMLVGVGAFIASAVDLPVTAILLVLEMTQNYTMVLPIMVPTVTACMFARYLGSRSIYRVKARSLDESKQLDVLIKAGKV
jgi:CIC family chloride channel protein